VIRSDNSLGHAAASASRPIVQLNGRNPQCLRGFLRLSILIAILGAGIFLRLPPEPFEHEPFHALRGLHLQSSLKGIGVDEKFYRYYVQELGRVGVGFYPRLVLDYVQTQKELTGAVLPPLRFLYIFCAFAWQKILGGDALGALHNVSATFSILTLLLATVFAARVKHPGYSLALPALMAFAPTQVHVSQHVLIDGFFAFWALLVIWLLWESVRHPKSHVWTLLYGFALVALVLTKENALFVWLAILATLITNRWVQIGTVTRELFIATFLAPAIGIAVLALLAGGIPMLIETYQLFFVKNFSLKYSALTQDGPWHRYLVDLLLVSPIVLLLAIGCVSNITREKKLEWFLAIFVLSTYAMMCGIRYGINLRFGNMWDLPLRMLAVSQLALLAAALPRWRNFALAALVGLICVLEIRNYAILEVKYPLYDLVTVDLMRALQIIKLP
jgi:4-amino-4-deoxy-L-arabinose transferase-like glycosyltransferase